MGEDGALKNGLALPRSESMCIWTGMAKGLGQNQFVGPIICFKSKVAFQGSSSDQADVQDAP